MADPKGFMTTPRELPTRRPVDVRIHRAVVPAVRGEIALPC